MLRTRLTLAVLACAFGLTACDTEPPDPGEPEYVGPAVIDLEPSPGQEDFFFQSDLWVRFEWAPESADLAVVDPAGDEVAGQTTIDADGVLYTFDPVDDLLPSSDYTLRVRVGAADSPPLQIGFSTSPHGLPIDPEVGGLWGSVFHVELSEAVMVEPASAGPLVFSQLDSWNLLLGVVEESSFAPGDQPGVHIRMARGRSVGDGWVQDPCSRTAGLTLGPDGLLGTEDDVAATWEDPRIQLGPRDLDFAVGLVPVSLKDLRFEGIFHPELVDMRGFMVEGTVDTRALDVLFQAGEAEGMTCSLLEALDIECEECGGDNPGPFCLPIRTESVAGDRVSVPPLAPSTCADVIEYSLATGECSKDVEQWEPAGDGSYALCPEYSPPVD